MQRREPCVLAARSSSWAPLRISGEQELPVWPLAVLPATAGPADLAEIARAPADDPRWPGHWLLSPAVDDLPEQRLFAGELTERVRAAVASLPPAQREVVTLRDIEGWTADEVCRLLGLSEVNQRVLLHRGRSKVRAALESYLAHERPLRHRLSDAPTFVEAARLPAARGRRAA